ncbi:MAG: diguanylate cyclase [Planctomycetota bacterium]
MPIVPGFEDFGTSEEIFDLVWRDDLTGLFNRRFFARYMKQVADWSEGGPPVCMAMMDMDNLKRINDRLGHLSGDTCLKRIGSIMLETIPEGCYPIRYAGDEFALVLPGMTRAAALTLADELRNRVARDEYDGANLPEGLRPSLSIGLAAFPEDAPGGGDDLTEAADKALYHSKRTGKNKVTSAADLIAGSETISDLEALGGFPARTLVGREQAFAVVDEALSLVLDGKNALLLVEGAPGTGKTRFLSELAKYAKERELSVLIERCNPVHREDPYRTLGGLLHHLLRGRRELYHAAQRAITPPQRLALREIVPVFRPRRPSSSGPASGVSASGASPSGSGSGVRRAAPARPTPPGRPERPRGSGAEPPRRDTGWRLVDSSIEASSVPTPLPEEGEGSRAQSRQEPGASGAHARQEPGASGAHARQEPGASGAHARQEPGASGAHARQEPSASGAHARHEPSASGAHAWREPSAAEGPRPSGPQRRDGQVAQAREPEVASAWADDEDTPAEAEPQAPSQDPKDAATKEPAAKDEATKDEAAKDEAAKDEATKDPATKDGAKDPAVKDPGAKDPGSGPQPRTEHPRTERLRPPPLEGRPRRPPPPPTEELRRRPPTSGQRRRPPPTGPQRRATGPRRPLAELRKLDPAELSVNLFTGVQSVLRALSAERALVVLLDDLDAADEPTLEVVRSLVGEQGRVLFVGSARTGSATVEVDATSTPYQAFRASFDELQGKLRVELTDLDEERTAELATTLLEGFRPPERLATPLFRFSRGNPLFVEGVLRHLIDAQLLKRVEDGWQVSESLPEEIPLTLEDLIRSQLAILDPETAAFLREAAVVGPNFDFNVLKVSAGKEQGEALDLVSDAVRHKLLRETGGAQDEPDLEFSSTAVADASYRELPPEERKAAHERVAQALGEGQGQEAALAYHFGKAGNEAQRERFLRRVRERRELLFNRAAIETILSAGSNLPEMTEEPGLKLTAQLPRLASALATAAKVIRLYPASSKVVQDALTELSNALGKAHEHAAAFTIGHRGNAFVLNGHAVDKAYANGQHQEAVVGLYRVNSIKSLTFVAPPQTEELAVFLGECAKHTVQVPLERYFWRVFAKEQGIKHLGIAQKTYVLKHRGETSGSGGGWTRPGVPELGEAQLPLVREVVRHFVGTLQGLKQYPAGSKVPTEAQAALDRALRQLFEGVPGLALHEGEEDAAQLVVNGAPLAEKALGQSGGALLRFLRETRLRGLVVLKEITPRELGRFMERVAQLPTVGAEGVDPAAPDPVAEIGADGSFPNVVVGEALFELAHGLVRGPSAAQTDEEEPQQELTLDDAPPIEELLPIPAREPTLPPDFQWPSEEVYQKAHRLWRLRATELLNEAAVAGGDFVDTMERLLLDERKEAHEAARLLVERLALNFAGQDVRDRKRSAEVFLSFSRKGTSEGRARFFQAALRRLADALELETDGETFEKLSDCAKAGILDRIAQGDWDQAARLTRALGLRLTARSDHAEMSVAARKALDEVLRDPRAERVFETIEGGSQQERRKAARVLETMGDVSVDRLVDALKETERGRVENFLIDMLAALVPSSENALRKEVTPSSPAEATIKLLRASGVVCRDPTPIFVSGLQHDSPAVQSAALGEARKVGGKVAQQVLRWALAHGTPQVQLEAVKHLGDLARPEAVDGMIQLAQGTTLVEVQRECCLAFGKLALSKSHSDKVVPVLATFLSPGFLRKDYHPDVRHAAAWALGQMTDNETARRTLSRALEDKDKRVRLTARLTLEGEKA